MKSKTAVLLLGAAMLLGPLTHASAQEADALSDGFGNPPASSRPRVWWHWMNGNVTEEGIAKDLAWMDRVGIGGMTNFDASLNTPQIVDRRLVYMDPEWKEAFRFAARTAQDKGLELTIASSPGWSETGGPWVQPENAMKKVVWSATDLVGGHPFRGKLTAPPAATGPFQDASLAADEVVGRSAPEAPARYSDSLVLAYLLDGPGPLAPVSVTVDGHDPLAVAGLIDGRYAESQAAQGAKGEPIYVQVELDRPHPVRSASLALKDAFGLFTGSPYSAWLQVPDGAGGYKTLREFPVDQTTQATISFPAVTAKSFRILFRPKQAYDAAGLGGVPGAIQESLFAPSETSAVQISELRLYEQPRVDQFEVKAGFGVVGDYYALEGGQDDAAGIDPAQVIDLTGRMRADGSLDWTPPPGRWRVLRMGWSLEGKTNHPATQEATGLEVDKYDPAAVRQYIEHYLDMYEGVTGPDLFGGQGLRSLLTDSIEVGPSNWTGNILAEFQQRRDYDPRPWLPALTGVIIGDRGRTDAFLYDFRRTLGDLIADYHYGTIAKVAHERGLKLYGEALESGRPVLGDDMAMRRSTDYPMAALWSFDLSKGPRMTLLGDMKGAASIAHIYGQNIAAAESMTSAYSPWAFAPADLQPIIDLEFAYGINRPVVHTSVHSPSDTRLPGLSLMIFGQYFNRHESWAEEARPWVDYMSRSAYLLQQGRYHADVAYFYGEDAPMTVLYENGPPKDVPRRFAYDLVGYDALASELGVDAQGLLTTKSGMRYRLLQLGGTSEEMTLPALRKIAALVERGATVLGDKPAGSPSLADDKAAFVVLADRLWSGAAITRYGKGQVIVGHDADATLMAAGRAADFAADGAIAQDAMLFLHRQLDQGDLYFVTNRTDRSGVTNLRFGVTGYAPELWDAVTGLHHPVSYRVHGGQTVVPLDLVAYGSAFVVFRGPAAPPSRSVPAPVVNTLGSFGNDWSLSFLKGPARPEPQTDVSLGDWSKSSNARLRYFSGTASYRRVIDIPPSALANGKTLKLDLGRVGDVAHVFVNGKDAGIVWKAPYAVDVTKFARAGKNEIEIQVTNLWVNRLIGDKQPAATPVTFTAAPTYHPDAPLRSSGLIGPVVLKTEK